MTSNDHLNQKLLIFSYADHFLAPSRACFPEIKLDNFELYMDYFDDSKQYHRISFPSFDTFKVCRGEYFPYEGTHDWLIEVQHSIDFKIRQNYEMEHYQEDLLKEGFRHYIFHFHDGYIEVITTGFWIEPKPVGQELSDQHPFQPIRFKKIDPAQQITIENNILTPIPNPVSLDKLLEDSIFCAQQIMHYYLCNEQNEHLMDYGTIWIRTCPINQIHTTIFTKPFCKSQTIQGLYTDPENLHKLFEAYLKWLEQS